MTRTAPVSWDWSTAFAVAGLAATSAGDDGRDEAQAVVQLVDDDTGAVAFARMDDSVDVAARVARVVRRGRRGQAARSWEQTRRPEGLRWFRPVDLELPRFPVDDKGLARLTVGRSILFLHDVLGYTELDFEALDPSVHLALTDRYEGRLIGYDHHTLCVDPAQNAQALVTALSRADGPITMDVVALGRGGLIARHLVERTAHLTDGRLTVNSVVAIGTPHLGVDLAGSDRLLTWINRVVSLDGPSDLAGGVAAILAHVLGSSADVLHGMSAEPVTPPTGVPWRCIAGTDPRTAGDGRWSAVARWVADPAVDDEPNDRFVTVRSALPEGASGVEVAARHDVLVASAELTDELRARYVDAPPSAPSVRTDGIIVHRGARDIGASWVATDVGAPTDDRPLPPLLTVCLQHGSLEHVDDPVLVGHFAGSPLSGAEERLDDCLDHRLSRAQVARDYPDAYGEFRHFPGDHRRRPGGAIVMGLGPIGDLTSSRLTTVVTRSVIRYASEARDLERLQRGGPADRWAEPLELGLSSVLIGTSRSSGLTVEASIRAIIAGVVAANLRLRPLAAGGGASVGAVAVTRLRLVERYEDVVELTARALDQLANEDRRSTGGPPVEYDPVPAMSEGAAGANAPSDTANDVWTRVSVSQEPPDVDGLSQLTYSMMARQARAEEITHRVDQALVDSIVAQSIDRSADPRVGATLYELLLPHDLKQPLGAGSHLQLLVGDTAADYPWELLTPRDEAFRDGRPLSLTAGVLRQFVETTNIRRGPTRAAERSVLVIGNPPAGPDLPSLWGAAAEAVEVRRAFECATDPKWNVTARIWDGRGEYTGTPMDDDVTPDPAENLVHELMNGSWRVVHVAAHGTNDTSGDATTTSGVVLSQRFHLAPATIGQLSVVPDLVVVNACHLGAIARQLTGMNKVAASFARRLMQIGVRAVIVAGWAIDDDAAATFAETLYRELLDGRELGDALFSARSDVHSKHPDSLTWGAYQCYGDPGFRLAPRGQGRRLGGPSLTVSELRRKIRAAAGTVSDRRSSISAFRREVAAVSEAASQFEGVEADLRATLEQLEGEDLYVDAKPVVRADLDAELAAAWAELGRFDRAVQHYEAALAGGGRNVPVTAIEQLANLSMRHAKELSPGPQRRRLVANAKRYLTALDAFGETPERLALWASFYKKRATMATPPDRDDIDLAAEKYQTASNDPSAGRYHHLNARQLTAISNHYAGRPVAVATKRKRPDDESPTDFWERNAIGDEMLTALVEDALSGAGLPERATKREVTRMVDAYRDAFLLRSSAANRRSVVDHIEDLADLLPDVPVRGELRSAVTRLRAMEQPAAATDDAPPSADQGATG